LAVIGTGIFYGEQLMLSLKKLAGYVSLGLIAMSVHAAQVDVDAFVKKDRFESIKISPTGEYFAATVPFEDRTALVIMSRADKKLLGTFQLGRNSAIASFDWVSPDRVVIGAAEKFGELDKPQPTGELFAMDANGGKTEMLVGQRVAGNTGSHIQTKKAERVAAFLIDDLPNDDTNVLISVMPFSNEPYTRVERMNAYTGQRQVVTRAPVRNAGFATDNHGVVRFALGSNTDNTSKLYYRADGDADWALMNDEAASHRVEAPIGFSADDRTAYLLVEQSTGPDAVVAYDIATGKRSEALRDKEMDPEDILYKPGSSIPVGALYDGQKPRLAFFDETSSDARLYHSLQAAFGDNAATITSSTRDGRLNLVQAWSGRNPGDFYLFDGIAKKAEYVISRADWLDPANMAAMRPIAFAARDGLALKGYLTTPNGVSGKDMPMVVMPHGGPFTISDTWGFDEQAQMLAAAGYAVLQVNFRGSGGRGRQFLHSGERQWGLSMQDDITDATRWAIQQGIADPQRICIYGASYGAFAALMGVAKEPGLYKCAAGYVGVYDLPQLHGEETSKHGSIRTWANEWIGDDMDVLAANSPTRRAANIKVPVLLAAGREDTTAPVEHTERMERALKAAGVQVEASYYDGEGHGFYKPENRKDFYTKLLAFLSRNLGGSQATNAAVAAGK
jgi:dipeptidyl aminopeptidase/acylaminoacyl peptidase